MSRVLDINMWIGVQQGCSMECEVLDTKDTVFTFGGGGLAPLEMVFDVATLRELVQMGTGALKELGVHMTPEGAPNGKS